MWLISDYIYLVNTNLDLFLSLLGYQASKMLHEILLSLWGCSTSVSQMIEIGVRIYYI